MSKKTIFGEEYFIDTEMIKLVKQRNNAIDDYVFEQMENTIKGTLFVEMPQVEIDKEKLKKWVILCVKLENIEHSDLIDMATKKKIDALKEQLTITEKALELACKNSRFEDTCDYCEYKDFTKSIYGCPCYCESEQGFEIEQAIKYFKTKAKEMMKSE